MAVRSTLVSRVTHLMVSEEDLLLEFGFDISAMALLAQSTHCISRNRPSSLLPRTHQQPKGRKFFALGFMDVFRVNQVDFWQCTVPVPGSQAPSCW